MKIFSSHPRHCLRQSTKSFFKFLSLIFLSKSCIQNHEIFAEKALYFGNHSNKNSQQCIFSIMEAAITTYQNYSRIALETRKKCFY